jgi:acetyl-CoA acetyltransferase
MSSLVREVHVLGVGATSFARTGRSGDELAREAITAALADAGVRLRDVPAFTLARGNGGSASGDSHLFGVGAGRPLPPVCVSGAAALHLGWLAVSSGVHDLVLCVGRELAAPGDEASRRGRIEALAATAGRYLDASGATEEQLARVVAKNRQHGAANPRALLTTAVAAREVLDGELVEWPLRDAMVAPPSEGAAAVVLSSRERGRRSGARAPRILASTLVREGGVDPLTSAAGRAARIAYDTAGVGPENVDCAEIDHPTAAGELPAYEALQFAPDGQGAELVDSGFTALGGVLPVNTSGGALAQGEAAGAAGIAQLCELAWQLRGEAGRRQVPGARVGLALASGHESDRGIVSLTLLKTG